MLYYAHNPPPCGMSILVTSWLPKCPLGRGRDFIYIKSKFYFLAGYYKGSPWFPQGERGSKGKAKLVRWYDAWKIGETKVQNLPLSSQKILQINNQ